METIDRRRTVRGILCGTLAAAGFALMPGATEAQVVVVGPHHRHHWHHHPPWAAPPSPLGLLVA